MNDLGPQRSPVALGGMLAALAVVLGMAGRFLPLVGDIFAPLPLALAGLLLPAGWAALCGVAATLVLGTFLGLVSGAAFFLQTVCHALLCGILVRRGWRFGALFAAVTAAKVGGGAFNLGLQLLLTGNGPGMLWQSVTALEEEMLTAADTTGVYAQLAAAGSMTAAEVQTLFAQTVHIIVQLSPAIYTLIDTFWAALMLWLFASLCRRIGTPVQVAVPQWRTLIMPPAVLVPFLAAWILLLVERHFDDQVLWIVAANVMVIGAACMVVDGFSYTLARLRFSERPLMWQFIYVLIAVMLGWYLIVVFAVIGVFDCIADYRGLRTPKGE